MPGFSPARAPFTSLDLRPRLVEQPAGGRPAVGVEAVCPVEIVERRAVAPVKNSNEPSAYQVLEFFGWSVTASR